VAEKNKDIVIKSLQLFSLLYLEMTPKLAV